MYYIIERIMYDNTKSYHAVSAQSNLVLEDNMDAKESIICIADIKHYVQLITALTMLAA